MEQTKIDRINALARYAAQRALTPEEQAERAALRAEYVAAMKASLRAQLDGTVVEAPDGSRRPLGQKPHR